MFGVNSVLARPRNGCTSAGVMNDAVSVPRGLVSVCSSSDQCLLSEYPDRLLLAAGSIGHCNTALSLSAGVANPKVFLGRWFRRNAILFKYA